MATGREQQLEAYYRLVDELTETCGKTNHLAAHLGIETRYVKCSFYKEQLEQLEEIQTYFRKVGMSAAQTTENEILTMALSHFYQFVKHIENE
ncbi:hypothetical protein M3212_14195 [Alkalihalobacillus oceani]|uniref:hypothetical protein n=1 Tax=Halalkalibacter oceani TaxID=1653776 RepID=UPI00203E5F82|nr:hypothetical protein [Halalkalibacter oceani]MCM3761923.1 hypothetical protein [Halalkalibacter oceani]